jgi:hypothetical protein
MAANEVTKKAGGAGPTGTSTPDRGPSAVARTPRARAEALADELLVRNAAMCAAYVRLAQPGGELLPAVNGHLEAARAWACAREDVVAAIERGLRGADSLSGRDFVADPDCYRCHGRGRVGTSDGNADVCDCVLRLRATARRELRLGADAALNTAKLDALLGDLLDHLEAAGEYFDDRADTVDGPDSQPAGNMAMALAEAIHGSDYASGLHARVRQARLSLGIVSGGAA